MLENNFNSNIKKTSKKSLLELRTIVLLKNSLFLIRIEILVPLFPVPNRKSSKYFKIVRNFLISLKIILHYSNLLKFFYWPGKINYRPPSTGRKTGNYREFKIIHRVDTLTKFLISFNSLESHNSEYQHEVQTSAKF